MDCLGSIDAERGGEAARGVALDAGEWLGSVGTGAEAVEGRGCGYQRDTLPGAVR